MDISVRQGETFQMPIEIDDTTAQTVRMLVWNDSGVIIDESDSFVDGEALIDAGIVVADIGEYKYTVTVTYTDGVVDILPDISSCGDCELPAFEICVGNPADGGS